MFVLGQGTTLQIDLRDILNTVWSMYDQKSFPHFEWDALGFKLKITQESVTNP